jgi:nucleoside-diphosphate-sugar epimerase
VARPVNIVSRGVNVGARGAGKVAAMDTVLLTGASGFLGRRLAADLLDAGYEVRAILGAPTLASSIDRRLAAVPGGVRDRPGLAAAMLRVDAVVHLETDDAGTRNVLAAAERAGVGRVILCSSDVSLGDTAGELRDETNLGFDREPAARSVVRAVVGALYGPGDPGALGALIARHLERRLALLPRRLGGCTFTHVDDAARAVRLVLERGRPGGSYLVGGEPASFERFFAVLAAETGLPAPRLALPRWLEPLLPVVAPGLAEVHAALGRGATRYFSSRKAQRELGCSFRPLARGLAETLPGGLRSGSARSRGCASSRPSVHGPAPFPRSR